MTETSPETPWRRVERHVERDAFFDRDAGGLDRAAEEAAHEAFLRRAA